MGSHRVGHDWSDLACMHALEKEMATPLQCSSLENPRDRGAWWAAIYGVAQSRTQLKWLSSSSSSSSIIYVCVYILFFHYGLSQDIECDSLCYTVGPCCLSILYIIVCIGQPQTPTPLLPCPPPLWQPQSVFCVCVEAAFLTNHWFPKVALAILPW